MFLLRPSWVQGALRLVPEHLGRPIKVVAQRLKPRARILRLTNRIEVVILCLEWNTIKALLEILCGMHISIHPLTHLVGHILRVLTRCLTWIHSQVSPVQTGRRCMTSALSFTSQIRCCNNYPPQRLRMMTMTMSSLLSFLLSFVPVLVDVLTSKFVLILFQFNRGF